MRPRRLRAIGIYVLCPKLLCFPLSLSLRKFLNSYRAFYLPPHSPSYLSLSDTEMALTHGLLGTVGEPGKVITACTEVSIFLIDAWALRVPLSRIRITVKPEPCTVPFSTNVYSIQEISGLHGRFRLVYNCRHDQLTDVDDCSACDKGTVLDKTPQIDRVMFEDVPLLAMEWLSRNLTAIGAKGYVKMQPGIVREIEWWLEHPEEKPQIDLDFHTTFFGANRTPIPWAILCAERYNFADVDINNLKPKTKDKDEDVHMGNTSSPGSASQSTAPTFPASITNVLAPTTPTRAEQGIRELYWDPVYDAHDQNVVPNVDDWPDEFPPIFAFPMRAW
jgi:hypothetical protein